MQRTYGVRGVPVNSPCLYSPVNMLIYEREAFLHNAANDSFHGSQNQEIRRMYELPRQRIQTVTAIEMAGHPSLNPD